MALRRAGVDVEIFEAHPRTADDVGAFLTLQTKGMDALRAIDAYRAVAGRGFATPVMQFYSWTAGTSGRCRPAACSMTARLVTRVRRSDLYTALRDEAVRRGVRIHHGRRLVDAGEHTGGVTATFHDGSTVTGDLLVGCDGVRSRVRTIIDPAAPPARRVPLLNLGGYARGVTTGRQPGSYHMVFGKRAFFGYAPAPDGETWWFANPPAREDPGHEVRASTDAQWRAIAPRSADAVVPARVAGNGARSLAWMHRYHIDRDAPVAPDAATRAATGVR